MNFHSGILLAGLCAASVAGAGTIGIVADASLWIPPNPGLEILQLSKSVVLQESYTILVTGGTGDAYLKLWTTVANTRESIHPDGFYSSSRVEWTAERGSYSVDNSYNAWGLNGVFCALPFTFDVPFELLVTAQASTVYSYEGISQRLGLIPLMMSGGTVTSSASIDGLTVMSSSGESISEAQVFFNPEPQTGTMLGLIFLAYVLKVAHRNSRESPRVPSTVPRLS